MDQNRQISNQEVYHLKMQTKKNLYEKKMPFGGGKQNEKEFMNRNANQQIFQQTLKQTNQNNLNNLPYQINELIKKNKYLQKQNIYLRQQLKQKKAEIKNLKQQVYQSILDETQNKLYCLKLIQQESDSKAKQVLIDVNKNQIIDRKMGKLYESDEKFLQLKSQIDLLQQQLRKERKTNELLAKNVVQLKDYIISAMEEKDLIIHELKNMIMSGNQNHRDIYQTHINYQKLQNDFLRRPKSKQKTLSMKQANRINIEQKNQNFNSANKAIKAKIVKNY